MQFGASASVGLNRAAGPSVQIQAISLQIIYTSNPNYPFPSYCNSSYTPPADGSLGLATLQGCNVPANSYVKIAVVAESDSTTPPAYVIDSVMLFDSTP